MKKVLIISLAYFPRVGGAEIALKEITDRMPDVEWHMVTKRFAGEPQVEKIGRVVVNRIGDRGDGMLSKFFFQFSAAIKALGLHRRHEYDAVWAMMAHSAGVPAALFNIFAPKVPIILTLQEGDPPEHVERVMRPLWPLFVRVFKRAAVVQAISTFLGEWAKRRGFSGQLAIIPNGVDTKKFVGEPVSHEGLVLITTSRLVHKNAVDDIIRAMPELPEAKLQILGFGPEEGKLKNLAGELKVASRVEFLGQIAQDQIPGYLHKADIFVRPSRSEGMGNSFIEAMAAGLPVVATQEGGISDFLFDAKRNPAKEPTGWAVDPDSPPQIAAAVKEIAGNPEAAKKVTDNARSLVLLQYDWDHIAGRMREEVFNRVLV